MFKKIKQKGMTLAELIVAIGIFVIIVTVAVGIFLSALKANRKIKAQEEILDNARYSLETISKELRMSEIVNVTGTFNNLNVTAYKNRGNSSPINYYLRTANGRIYKDDTSDSDPAQPITDAGLNVTDLKFYVSKTDNIQPKVTIMMYVSSRGSKPEEISKIRLQTTVSSRSYIW